MYSPRQDFVRYLHTLQALAGDAPTIRVGDLRAALRMKGIHLDDSKGSPLSAQGANSATSACKKLYAADVMLNPPPNCPPLGTGRRKIPKGEPGEGNFAPKPLVEVAATKPEMVKVEVEDEKTKKKKTVEELEKTSSQSYKDKNKKRQNWLDKRDVVLKWLFEPRKVEGQKKKDPPHIQLPKIVESAKSISTATSLHSSLTQLSGSAGVFGYDTTPTEGTTE